MLNSKYFGRLKLYLSYYIKARTRYSIHSPFLHQFIAFVFDKERVYYDFQKLHQISEQIKLEEGILPDERFSRTHRQNGISLSGLYKKSGHDLSEYECLYRLALFLKPSSILELGACTGMSSMALYLGAKPKSLKTLEGNQYLSAYCNNLFKNQGISSAVCIHTEFKEYLESAHLKETELVFIDGHHQYAPTMSYTKLLIENSSDRSVIIMDDIHWSEEMYKAWNALKMHPQVHCSLETFRWGFLFKDSRISSGHYCLISSKWKPWSIGLF